jgi:hypothetical protein
MFENLKQTIIFTSAGMFGLLIGILFSFILAWGITTAGMTSISQAIVKKMLQLSLGLIGILVLVLGSNKVSQMFTKYSSSNQLIVGWKERKRTSMWCFIAGLGMGLNLFQLLFG